MSADKLYLGVNEQSAIVEKMYLGINLQSTQIQKLYMGINNQSVLIFPPNSVLNGIYGAEWDGSSSPAWTRTDDAVSFSDPVAAVNNGTGSSPFDNIMPWSGMRIVEDSAAGTLVEIPKYYYKWTFTGIKMKLQISASSFEGSLVSPAHADRGDGNGERDYVYVGRYHCASTYKSTTGVKPKVSTTRVNFRTGIHRLGYTIWQYDFAMHWTIMMLYLVEFANWNTQEKIGYGCGNLTSSENSGSTDSMQYHTGTNAATRTTYGHVQYRHIEGLWDNVVTWCDGIRFDGTNMYAFNNPANYNDTAGGTLVGTRLRSSDFITAFSQPSVSGFEYALFPSAVGGSDSTYVCDYYTYNNSGNIFAVGGYYDRSQKSGGFRMYASYTHGNTSGAIGSRLQKLP